MEIQAYSTQHRHMLLQSEECIYTVVNPALKGHIDLHVYEDQIKAAVKQYFDNAQDISILRAAYGFSLPKPLLSRSDYHRRVRLVGKEIKRLIPELGSLATKFRSIEKYGKGKNFKRLTSKSKQYAETRAKLWSKSSPFGSMNKSRSTTKKPAVSFRNLLIHEAQKKQQAKVDRAKKR